MDKLNFIIDYIKSGEKPQCEENLGVECEHLILNRYGRAVGYFDEGGTQDIFKRLVEKHDFIPYFEDGHILSCKKNGVSISTEPGGQIEFSSVQKRNVSEVEEAILNFYDHMVPIVESYGNSLYTVPFQPVSSIDDYKILPKERYYAMYDYFKSHGKLSHLMMKATTSLQCSIDYHNEKDYGLKYGIATRLSNIIYTLFDNVAFKNNRPIDSYAFRGKIWENTDPCRTGVLERAFRSDFGYEDYARKLLDVDAIFVLKDGKFKRFSGTIGEAIDESTTIEELEHLFTMVFFDVRTKKFIEIRMCDALPWPFNVGYVALLKSIFYNDDNLYSLWNMLGDLSYKEHVRSREEIYRKGANAKLMGKSIKKWGQEILGTIEIDDNLFEYIEPIVPILEGRTLRDSLQKFYFDNGEVLVDALKMDKVSVINR